jgi:hypothetical protein
MARKKRLSQRKQTIKQYAYTFAPVVIKAIIGWIAQKAFAALLVFIVHWLTKA